MCKKPYRSPALPPIFVKETDKISWEQRRQEILDTFYDEVFGRPTHPSHEGFSFGVETLEKRNVVIHEVTVSKQDFSASFTVHLPKTEKPCPVLIVSKLRDFCRRVVVPYAEALRRGYGIATFSLDDVSDEILGNGRLLSLLAPEDRSSCGSISVWAFFISLIVDYLYTLPVDKTKIGVAGHSRGGKVALWAGATDRRISFVFSNNSGCSGAALARGNTGEKLADIQKNFPYWFSSAYRKYIGKENALPVDFHELTALQAPRLVYITSSTRDGWACPKNEFLSAWEGSAVYREVFGIEGLVADNPPKKEKSYRQGAIGYHIKRDVHSLREVDWQRVFAFLKSKGWES